MPYSTSRRSVGEILDGAAYLYRARVLDLLGLSLLVTLPFDLLAVTWAWAHPPDPARPGFTLFSTLFAQLGPTSVGGGVANVALAIVVSSDYLGEPVTLPEALRRLGRRWWPVLGASLAASILEALGFLCCVVPGVFASLAYFVVAPVIANEGDSLGVNMILRRSSALTKQDWKRLVGLAVVGSTVMWSFVWCTAQLVPASLAAVPILGGLVPLLPLIFVRPFWSAMLTLTYFDQRARKEGFDLYRRLEALPALAVARS